MSNKRIKDEVAVVRQEEVTITAEVKVVKPEEEPIEVEEVIAEVEELREAGIIEELDTSIPYCPRCTDNSSVMGLGEIEMTSEWKSMRAECMTCGNRFKVKLWHDSDEWEFVE